ncbi:MAG: L,D-transpeptidase [Candidatus Competibacterales bacterium]|nr:L,D-transpeptidase [Candidatus Competibacterales bacterium]
MRAGIVLCLLAVLLGPASAAAEPWLLVDSRAGILRVMDSDGVRARFENPAFGVAGVGIKQRRGDGVTPRGTFRVAWINPRSRFRLFFGLDYPNREHATLALHDGRIDPPTYRRIVDALEAGRTPPQDTPLGGAIGIHGLGGGDPWIHANLDWTDGCVALDDAQIDALRHWIRPGMRVEIR